jgi:hypothetical protein
MRQTRRPKAMAHHTPQSKLAMSLNQVKMQEASAFTRKDAFEQMTCCILKDGTPSNQAKLSQISFQSECAICKGRLTIDESCSRAQMKMLSGDTDFFILRHYSIHKMVHVQKALTSLYTPDRGNGLLK